MKSNHKSFDWKTFIKDHPLFGELTSDETRNLLDSGNSTHRAFNRDDVIFRAGEISNTFFLIGEGSVNVELSSEDSSATNICSLYKGDYFGEMSAIDEQSGRAATILANEDCLLLEIKSKPFLKVLKANPELEFKLLSMLAARLRQVNDHLLKSTRLSYDTKFSLLSEKIESQGKVVDASLDASQAVFEQTKIRTSEVINAAERGRSRTTWVMSVLTTVFTVIFGIIGFLGYKELQTAEVKSKEIDDIVISIQKKEVLIQKSVIQAENAAKSIADSAKDVDELKKNVANVDDTLAALEQTTEVSRKALQILFRTFIPIFSNLIEEKIRSGNASEPGTLGLQILELNDAPITMELFRKIFFLIDNSHRAIMENRNHEQNRARVSFCTNFMYLYLYDVDGRTNDNELAQFLSNYFLLITYAMDDDYAKDNDFYHKSVDAKLYPLDGFDARLRELKYGDVFSEKAIKELVVKNNLVEEFRSELEHINNPEGKIPGSRKSSINEVLGYKFGG